MENIKKRLEELRIEIRAERISQGEIIELQSLIEHIDKGDVELLQWAGVPEFEDEVDLFETPENLPQEVQDVLIEFGEVEGFDGCKKLIDALEPLGYTCDYDLSATPYGLKKI